MQLSGSLGHAHHFDLKMRRTSDILKNMAEKNSKLKDYIANELQPRLVDDAIEPLTPETFERRLNSLSQAVNVLDEFHQALISQHPQYGKRLSDIS